MCSLKAPGLRVVSSGSGCLGLVGLFWLAGFAAVPAQAGFHFMQIEQVIGGVNGDTTAQAIQLRMRFGGQIFVSNARLRAFDASGLNPVLLVNMTTDVTNSGRVLIATPNFSNYTTPALVKDFNMTNPIPASYLNAGRITFEDDGGFIYWSLSFSGGVPYTGSTTGSTTNDADGDFGPSFPFSCPSTTLQAMRFKGIATDPSTNNAVDYELTTGAAVFTNNAGNNFTVTGPIVTQWRSIRPHNDINRAIVLNPTASGNGSSGPTVESRDAVRTIEADFNAPVTLTGTPEAGVAVSDGANSYSASSVTPVDGNTISIDFEPGVLPDQKCYTITIGPGVVTQSLSGDLDCKVRALVGDTTGNGKVNLSDAIFTAVKASSSTAAADAPGHDVDLSGGDIDLNDVLFIKSLITSPPRQAVCN